MRREEAEADLVDRARQQDRSAFAELYDFYIERVYAFSLTYTHNREDAEDLTSQTFESALSAIGRYRDQGAPFSSWLLRIAANAAMKRARHNGRVILMGDDSSWKDGVIDARNVEIDEWVSRWERADWLQGHMAALPPDYRRVIQLRYWKDLPLGSVAQRMGRSETATRQLLRRAIKALRARITEDEGNAKDDGL